MFLLPIKNMVCHRMQLLVMEKVAISLIKKFTDSPVNAGSLPFAGSALAIHNIDGKPFTVTYTIVGKINQPKPITNKTINFFQITHCQIR